MPKKMPTDEELIEIVKSCSNDNLEYVKDDRFPVVNNYSKVIVFNKAKNKYDTVTLNYLRFNKYNKKEGK